MVKRERYGTFNVHVSSLFDPPAPQPGLDHWRGCSLLELTKSLPFEKTDMTEVGEQSDFIRFAGVFDYRVDSDLCDEFLDFVNEFHSLTSLQPEEPFHDLTRNEDFVTAAKYPFVLRQILRTFIGQDYVFCIHLPYLVEAEDDLLASLELALLGYSKQAIQMLRSVLEVTIAHAYLGSRAEDYDYLVANPAFRMPAFGGTKGMVKYLIDNAVINNELANEGQNLYGLLSQATHSHIRQLNITRPIPGVSLRWSKLAPRVGAALLELLVRFVMKGV